MRTYEINKFKLKKYSIVEGHAIKLITGMHCLKETDVRAVCVAMGLEQYEWDNIKDDCSWLTDYEKSEIEDYLQSLNVVGWRL